MQTEPSSSSHSDPAAPPPTEDSGLHDIRSLAQSTKMRISARRVTGSPIDEDRDIAASSAGWKAVALPEPAKMVSLPELADLPSASEIKAREKAAKKAAKDAEKAAAKKDAAKPEIKDEVKVATAVEPTVTPITKAKAPKPAAAPAKPATKSNTGRNVAIAALGLAAAAGIGFVIINGNNTSGGAPSTADSAPAIAKNDVKPTVTPAPPPPPAPVVAQVQTPPADADKPAEVVAVVAPPKTDAPSKPIGKAMPKKTAEHTVTIQDTNKKPEPAPEKTKKPEAKDPNAKPGDPSFDALLKEAGVDDKKTEDKPKLAKKALSAGDITSGMSGAAGKAQACFKGTQGTASVRLTVAPSGQVTKVIVSGVFAGKPEAACLESALRGITFPPWDGGPQSFGYSYLLSE